MFTNIYEPVLLVLTRPDGKLEDASARIAGQENGGTIPGISFSHDMSVGDVDGDGDIDFMTAKFVFLNDGRGNFTPTSALHPAARPTETYVMSTAIGDLNDDGVGDLVVCQSQEGGPRPLAHILLSKNGSPSLTDRELVTLPDTMFGPFNSRQNEVAVVDVTGDGRLDIVFGVTRVQPYYQGRAIRRPPGPGVSDRLGRHRQHRIPHPRSHAPQCLAPGRAQRAHVLHRPRHRRALPARHPRQHVEQPLRPHPRSRCGRSAGSRRPRCVS